MGTNPYDWEHQKERAEFAAVLAREFPAAKPADILLLLRFARRHGRSVLGAANRCHVLPRALVNVNVISVVSGENPLLLAACTVMISVRPVLTADRCSAA